MMRVENSESEEIAIGLFNIVLRVAAGGSKFILVLALARYLAPAELGTFGLVTAAITIAVYLIGAEYYVFNSRELLSLHQTEKPSLIGEQAVVHLCIYVATIPLFYLFVRLGFLPRNVVFWFIPIAISEHLSTEGTRLLIVLSRSRKANIVFFLRSGLWTLVVVALMAFNTELRKIDILWPAWLIGSATSVVLAAWWLRDIWYRQKMQLRWSRILRGLRVSIPFIISILCFRGIFVIDRYLIEFYHSSEAVGVYTLFFGIANFVLISVEAGVAAVKFPVLISIYQKGDLITYMQLVKRFKKLMIVAVLGAVALAAVGIFPTLYLVERPIYRENLVVYWTLLLGAAIYSFSLIPHYQLYAMRRDLAIVKSVAVGFAVSLLFNFLLVPPLGSLGAAAATLAASTAILVGKSLFASK